MAEKQPTVLLSVLDNYGGDPFDECFDIVFPCYGVKDLVAADELTDRLAVVIWGGADISPSIYGQIANIHTMAENTMSSRDEIEVSIAEKAIELGIPLIGVCRGAQLLCALAGGSLAQHVTNHAGGYHSIETKDKEKYNCPSLHHQMMWPWLEDSTPIPHELIAWAEPKRSKVYLGSPDPREVDGDNGVALPDPPYEPEIVWFNQNKSLCIQSHPEFINDSKHPFRIYCNKLVKSYIFDRCFYPES